MKADLHIHSVFSNDGRSTLEEIIEYAELKGLGCIAVTDHNCTEAYDLIKDHKHIVIVPGVEVSSSDGHILGYGIESDIERGMSISKTIEAIHNANGIAVAAHPYRWWSGIGGKNVTAEFDGVEGFNARSKSKDNARAFRLAMELDLPVTGGSDSHQYETVGNGYTVFKSDIKNKNDVIRAILDHDTEVDGTGRTSIDSLRYATKSITEWIGRGFKRM